MGQTAEPGQVFAGYRIERLLGMGGMGEVYLAHDRDLPRFVALKLLGGAVTDDPDVRARFQREADTAARLAHPNIVTIYARGEHEGRLWIAMEYIDGTDVGTLLRNGPLPPDYAVWIIDQTARALDHAHRNGILHRDVKPGNILIAGGTPQRVLLADFGIAKALDETAGLTRTGEVFASFRYAAPEQFDASSGIDRRTDVYALGGALHHLLTGSPPFPATTTGQLIHAHLHLPPPRPGHLNPALPNGFDAVVAKAMAKEREHRFDSCGELAEAAAAALADARLPRSALPSPPAAAPPPRHGRSRMLLLGVAALVVVLALGGGVAAVSMAWNSSEAAQLQQQRTMEEELEKAACDITEAITNYDYTDIDAYMRAIGEHTTGKAKRDFDESLPTLRDLLVENRTSTRVKDLQCYYKSGDATRAEVLVIGEQTVKTAVAPEPRTTQLSMVMTLENVDGRWLCSKLTLTAPK